MFDCWTHQFYSLSFLPKWSRKIATLCMGLLCKALWFKFILRFSLQTHLTFFNKRPNVLSLKLHKWDASTPIVSCLSGVVYIGGWQHWASFNKIMQTGSTNTYEKMHACVRSQNLENGPLCAFQLFTKHEHAHIHTHSCQPCRPAHNVFHLNMLHLQLMLQGRETEIWREKKRERERKRCSKGQRGR